MRAEWIKLRSVQSTGISLAVAASMVVFGTTGMIRTTLMAVPVRRRMLAAKAGVLALVALGASAAILLATYASTRLMGFPRGPLGDDLLRLLTYALSVGVMMLPSLVQQASGRRMSLRLGDGLFSPPVALLLMLAYAVVAVAVAMITISRRDA